MSREQSFAPFYWGDVVLLKLTKHAAAIVYNASCFSHKPNSACGSHLFSGSAKTHLNFRRFTHIWCVPVLRMCTWFVQMMHHIPGEWAGVWVWVSGGSCLPPPSPHQLTVSTSLNKANPSSYSSSSSSPSAWLARDPTTRCHEMGIHINKSAFTRTFSCTQQRMWKSTTLWGPLGESRAWATNGAGGCFSGRARCETTKMRLSHGAAGWRARWRWRPPVKSGWLSSPDSAPWMSVIHASHIFDNVH